MLLKKSLQQQLTFRLVDSPTMKPQRLHLPKQFIPRSYLFFGGQQYLETGDL